MKEYKVTEVSELKAVFEQNATFFVVNYSGMDVASMMKFRAQMRGEGCRVRVARNTLLNIACAEADRKEFSSLLGGQIALIYSDSSDVSAVAKSLVKSIKDNGLEVEIVGGLFEKSLFDSAEVKQLSKLPDREVLVGRLLGLMNSPAQRLVSVMNNTIAGLAIALSAVADQKSKEQK